MVPMIGQTFHKITTAQSARFPKVLFVGMPRAIARLPIRACFA